MSPRGRSGFSTPHCDGSLLQNSYLMPIYVLNMVAPSTLLTAFNTLLILGTIGLGISTYIFQKRTSLRESLEQLDSLWVEHRREYIGVFLHEFSYLPLLRENAVLKFYVRSPTPEEKANVGMIRNAENLIRDTFGKAPEDFLEYDRVTEAWDDESGLYLKTNTVDAVEVRQLAEQIQVDLELSIIDDDEIPPN
ncbi:hypothetical protein BN903_3 [Halorubrum sp. AJ67]|nr:hypothetical protein BN903_3 [Halorubrum sp. AJ67]